MMLISHISFDHFGRSGDVHARDGFAVVNFICERLFPFFISFCMIEVIMNDADGVSK